MPVNHNDEWIPNIVIGQDYDQHFADASIHFDVLGRMADFFGRDMPVHLHAQFLQIHFIHGGKSHFYIDEAVYNCEGASVFLTPPAIPHSFMTQKGITGYVLTVHQSMIWYLLSDSQNKQLDSERIRPICIEKRKLNDQQLTLWHRLEHSFEALQDEWQGAHSDKNFALESIVRLLLLQIMRLAPENSETQMVASEELRLFRRFSELLEQQFRNRWSLSQYCSTIGVSESRLNHICQRVANCPPKKLIHERVLQESKRMLRYSNLSINDIGFELGFTDPSYFSRFFRKQTGLTPKDFRLQSESKYP
ncbi:4-hydroxyphenylacetate catabolism regulatory protein HpaA [Oceanospirillum linum]|uniref:4-hydroxyphenylacetate catabolism regulatory protein HpaA n=1 Tax=Oceanospirillum linum TaxID=966 RepID=A0A1T1HED0_OCELI|nr:4-hydroxyphenylacetate catabolism regulatory protein HpaA [Oceanospirillum linum]OOV88183.1 4-hydroxyphenylacetate catabolism regulatory protein HpaA [Oceanospirillum linum]SEF46681.1 transcriptional regulator, AraC family [Oleiphilus messinensis]SMP02258.1 transcriptional regulator, AraC family [Oceanospirillum linum]